MKKFPKLFIPGPTHVSDDILDVLSTPQIGHRTPEISELIQELTEGIQRVLYTSNHVYLVSHAATGLWEMGVKNSCLKGVLHAVNGAFSSKWATVSGKCGIKTQSIQYEWGQGIKVKDVDEMLATGEFDVFAMVMNVISTMLLCPPPNRALVDDEQAPPSPLLIDNRSPKSIAFPVDCIST